MMQGIMRWHHLIMLAKRAIPREIITTMGANRAMKGSNHQRNGQNHYLMPMMTSKITKTPGPKCANPHTAAHPAIGAKGAILITI